MAGLRSNVMAALEASGVRLVIGKAVFKDSRTVMAGGGEYSADYIVIASGSVSARPDWPGMDLPGVLDSTALLDLDELPGRLCIIGGGVIGLEFASVFRSFGTEVTVVEYCREILPRYDRDIAKRLRQSLSGRGIRFSLQSKVESVERQPDGSLRVSWTRKDNMESADADKVLVAVGRRPCCDGLGLDAAGIRTDKGAIPVDDNMRTVVPHIFAIGDVNGRQLLAHAATFQGKVALQAIMSDMDGDGSCSSGYDLAVMPSAVFTMPEAASVGLTEEECKDNGIGYKVYKSFFRANGKAVCLGDTDGICKILASPEGKILGCHVLGPHSSDLVQEISSLMSAGVTADTLSHSVHIHPTLGEVLISALE